MGEELFVQNDHEVKGHRDPSYVKEVQEDNALAYHMGHLVDAGKGL